MISTIVLPYPNQDYINAVSGVTGVNGATYAKGWSLGAALHIEHEESVTLAQIQQLVNDYTPASTTPVITETQRRLIANLFRFSVGDYAFSEELAYSLNYIITYLEQNTSLQRLDVYNKLDDTGDVTQEFLDVIKAEFTFMDLFTIDAYYDNEAREDAPKASRFVGAGTWRFTSWKINGADVINPTETIVIDAANLDDLFEKLLPLLNENDPVNGGSWTFENTGDYARHWKLSSGNYADYGELRLYENATGSTYSKLTPLVEFI